MHQPLDLLGSMIYSILCVCYLPGTYCTVKRMLEEMNKMNDETEALRGDKRALTAKLRHTEAGGATRLSR